MRRTLDGHGFEPFGPDTFQKVIDAAWDLGLYACQANGSTWQIGEPRPFGLREAGDSAMA